MSGSLRDEVDGLGRCAACGGIDQTRAELMRWQMSLRLREQRVEAREAAAEVVDARHVRQARAVAAAGDWGALGLQARVEQLASDGAQADEVRRVARRLLADIDEAIAEAPTW